MDSRPPSNDITLEIILIHSPFGIVTYAKEYENCPAWSTIKAILITFSFYYIIRLDVWIPSLDILLHVSSWKWICMWQIRSIGCRSPWTLRTEHRTINDMMVQCLVAGDLEALILLPVVSMWAALCLNRDLRTTDMFIMSLPLPVKSSAFTINKKFFSLPCQVATEYVYVCECICICICVHIYESMHMYTWNKWVIENTTYCYIYDKIQCDAVTAQSVFSKHSHDRHTIARPWYGVSFAS